MNVSFRTQLEVLGSGGKTRSELYSQKTACGKFFQSSETNIFKQTGFSLKSNQNGNYLLLRIYLMIQRVINIPHFFSSSVLTVRNNL